MSLGRGCRVSSKTRHAPPQQGRGVNSAPLRRQCSPAASLVLRSRKRPHSAPDCERTPSGHLLRRRHGQGDLVAAGAAAEVDADADDAGQRSPVGACVRVLLGDGERAIRREVLRGCTSRLFTPSLALALTTRARLLLVPPPKGGLVDDAAGFASRYGPFSCSPLRALDAGLRPGPLPDRAASLLPGLLAATRTGPHPQAATSLCSDQVTKQHHLRDAGRTSCFQQTTTMVCIAGQRSRVTGGEACLRLPLSPGRDDPEARERLDGTTRRVAGSVPIGILPILLETATTTSTTTPGP